MSWSRCVPVVVGEVPAVVPVVSVVSGCVVTGFVVTDVVD